MISILQPPFASWHAHCIYRDITIIMKTLHSIVSLLVAAGSAGVALMTLAGFLSAELGFASLAVLGLTAFALFDYARPRRSLEVAAQVLRPSLPTESDSPVAYTARRAA